MRLKAIGLSWFRGAAETTSLVLDGKSMVVYGCNGAGKSSFVDAIEYFIGDGKLRHLTHEYSGRRQEKGIPNTHLPAGGKGTLHVVLDNGREARAEIAADGTAQFSGDGLGALCGLRYQCTILRQDEVADFIRETKGEKYSALLPLLGLHGLEIAADNLRQLARSIEGEARLQDVRAQIKAGEARATIAFGSHEEGKIRDSIEALCLKYRPSLPVPADVAALCGEVSLAIQKQLDGLTEEQARHVALKAVGESGIAAHVAAVRSADAALAAVATPLIVERLAVLTASAAIVAKAVDAAILNCPACGREIAREVFTAHIEFERNRLTEAAAVVSSRQRVVGVLCDALRGVQGQLSRAETAAWRKKLMSGPMANGLRWIADIDVSLLATRCSAAELASVEDQVLPLIVAAAAAAGDTPANVRELMDAKRLVDLATELLSIGAHRAAVARVEALLAFVRAVEAGARTEIRERANAAIAGISDDIQRMWAVLHPERPIEDVHLYVPEDSDKAIDIGLKFYGVPQESPRLTLSEGFRNSLGLCIFLAMAKRAETGGGPMFLDDVVMSFDHGHRGMIAGLIEQEFDDRQVVILTHDRDWFGDLRRQLPNGRWASRVLLPYDTPPIGIRWSERTTSFEDARASLAARPEVAGHDARRIMDVELRCAAEGVKLRLPYLRGERNDARTAHELLEGMIADAEPCFQKRGAGGEYVVHAEGIAALEEADRLLVSWGNRASHDFDVARAEAAKLINACEQALEVLGCSSCDRVVWHADAGKTEYVQCGCGALRWRYGKG